MSHNRQTAADADEDALVLRSLALGVPAGFRTGVHGHPWAQLVHASRGVLTVSTPVGLWVVPTRRAVWIPPGFSHEVEASGAARMQTLYLRPDRVERLPDACCVMPVSPLLRELVREVLRLGMLRSTEPAQEHLAQVLEDQLASTREAPLRLCLPTDPRARRVADRVLADLVASTPLAELAQGSGASPRTLERLFAAQTSHTFGRWRQRARLLEALKRLACGEPVTGVALDVGYDSPSAFIAMFKRVLGTTPRRWVQGS
jgi:AraC-like DNA-binding protein